MASLRPTEGFSGRGPLFSALAFDQCHLGQREVVGVAGVSWRVEAAQASALLQHQGVNVLLVLGVYRLHVPMHGSVLEKSGAHGQQSKSPGLVPGPLLYQFIQLVGCG